MMDGSRSVLELRLTDPDADPKKKTQKHTDPDPQHCSIDSKPVQKHSQ